MTRVLRHDQNIHCALNTFASLAVSCWALSIRIGLHKPHTTSCSASSFCCYHRRALKKPTKCSPPRETGAMWAHIRQSDSSHSIDWRDEPTQGVRAFPPNFQHDAQTSNFILCHHLVRFANSFEGPLRRLSFLPVSFLKVLTPTILHCKVDATPLLGTTVRIRTSFDLLRSLFERGFLLPLTLHPFLSFPRSVL